MAFPTNENPSFDWNCRVFTMETLPALQDPLFDSPAIVFAAITPDATGLVPLPKGPTRAIWSQAAGTLTGHDAFGNAITAIPLQAGWNKISVAGVTSIATTTSVWGVW
jgi:hypothetical protein